MGDVNTIELIKLAVIDDIRGNLAFLQNDNLPFELKRVYYLYDVPSSASRGGHSHKEQNEILIALSGSFEVIVNDGTTKKTFFLNKPNLGLYIKPGIWRELENFSSGAVCLVIASDVFEEEDYIREYDEFLNSKK